MRSYFWSLFFLPFLFLLFPLAYWLTLVFFFSCFKIHIIYYLLFSEINIYSHFTHLSVYTCEYLHCYYYLASKLCPTFVTPCTAAYQALLSCDFQARTSEWVAIFSSMGSSLIRDSTFVSCMGRQILYHWATREACLYCVTIYLLEYILI